MRGKLLFITGGLVGYVLGARAGRKRYDQIASAANDLWNAPPVQRRVNEARDFGLELVGDIPGVLLDAGKKIFSSVSSKATQGKTSSTAKTGDKPTAARTAATKAATTKAATTKAAAAKSESTSSD
ncbi:hypothetical protein [Cryobacterium roopkundense]|uniref:YtxH domain-containing protein n=1 Tax=Cryobacterium roopkundense TaxID=1001240 RepID=A0A7W9A0F9_9MICO|nr:hypothetical protein [Cryobacterium roopkundense]MBB5643307.1 hypothetical protein [Cryobacterium roopkundense]